MNDRGSVESSNRYLSGSGGIGIGLAVIQSESEFTSSKMTHTENNDRRTEKDKISYPDIHTDSNSRHDDGSNVYTLK